MYHPRRVALGLGPAHEELPEQRDLLGHCMEDDKLVGVGGAWWADESTAVSTERKSPRVPKELRSRGVGS